MRGRREKIDHITATCPTVEVLDVVPYGIRTQPLQKLRVAEQARPPDRAHACIAPAPVVLLAVLLLVGIRVAQARRGRVRVRAGPEAELHPLLALLFQMITERHVERGLNLWILLPVALGEAEEGLVAGVVRQGLGERAVCSQIDAQPPEPFPQSGVVGAEEFLEVHVAGIRAPVQE